MKHFTKNIIVLTFILTTTSTYAATIEAWKGKTIHQFLKEKMKIDFEFFNEHKITSIRNSKLNSTNEIITEVWSKNSEKMAFIEIHENVTNKEQFEEFRKTNFLLISKLYRSRPSPYPGIITSKEECPTKEFGPKEYTIEVSKTSFNILEGPTSSRFAFGACNTEDMAYQGAIITSQRSNSYMLARFFVSISDYSKNTNMIKDIVSKIKVEP